MSIESDIERILGYRCWPGLEDKQTVELAAYVRGKMRELGEDIKAQAKIETAFIRNPSGEEELKITGYRIGPFVISAALERMCQEPEK